MKKYTAFFFLLIGVLMMPLLGQAEEIEKVSIQLKWFHQYQFAGYYAAKEKGFFAEEGLDVDLREHAKGLDPIVEVTSGRAQYGVSDSGLLLSRIRGEPVVLVTQIFQHSPVVIVALRQSGLRTPYNLTDKSVMTYLQGHGDVALKAMVLQTLGDIDSVKWVEHTYRNQDVLDGKVDAMLAYITNEPFWFHEKGADTNIIDPRDFGIDLYGDNLFTSEEEKENYPERLEKVQRAVLKGWQYALDHPDEVVDLILRKYNTQNKSRPYLEYEARQTAELIDTRTYQLGHYEPSRYDKIASIYQRLSLANKPETPSGFYWQEVRTDGEAQTKVELTDEEKAWIKAHPGFRIAATPDWPPFEIREEDGAYSGISADFIRMAAHKVGLKPEPHFDKWRSLVEKLKNRELDVAPGLNETEDRKEFLAFSNFFIEQYSVIFTTNDHNDIKTMDDLADKTVAVEKGYALAEILARDYPAIKLVPVSNSFEAIQKVSLKEVDAYVGNQVVGSYLTKKNMITNVRTVGFYPGKHGQLRFGIRSDWPILRDILNKGLAAITTDERNTILTTYIDVDQGLRQRTVSLTDEERTWVEAHPVIRVASDPSFPPLEFRDTDGNVKGYSADLLAIAAKRIGVTVESVEALDRRDAEDKVRAGKADVLGISVKTDELAKGLIQTKAYQTFPSVIIVPNSQTGDISMENLSGKKVAVVAGWAEEAYLREHYPELDLQTVSNSEIGLNKLGFGDFDAFVTLLPNASHVIQEQGITSLRVGGRLPITFSYAFATRADMPVLARLLDKATASISQEEEKELLARWISLSVQEGLDIWTVLKWGGGIGGGALLIFTIIVTWNRRLGAEIEQRKRAQEALDEKNEMLEGLSNKLSKYLSPQVYNSIFTGAQEVTLKTERKKLTVFFSDIKNFTQTSEDLQPEDLTYILNDYFSEMSQIAIQHGATIDKFIGDAMLIFFGDPESRGVKEDAAACVRMAIAMQQRMHDLQQRWQSKGYLQPLQMRIGINTGYCNVGNFGSEDRMDYTIIGGEVNLAARLEGNADPDGILMSYETYSLVKDLIDAEERGAIQAKGIRKEVRAFSVLNIMEGIKSESRFLKQEQDGLYVLIDLDKLQGETRRKASKDLLSIAKRLRK